MSIPKAPIWPLDPHTKAKHEILRRYLSAWFPILASYHGRVLYIDGFCGPGQYSTGEKGSPIIALNVALNHQARFNGELVFIFIDEDKDRIANLKQMIAEFELPKNFNILIECGEFSDVMGQLFSELDTENKNLAPSFIFIDPFGFSGIPFRLVRKILQNPHCEVFINFMTDSINRWRNHPKEEIKRHIEELLEAEIADINEYLLANGNPSHSALRDAYLTKLQNEAKKVRYFEMRNDRNRPIYHLFFATNNPLGFVKMKEAMWATDPSGNFSFSDATNPTQITLFGEEPILSDLKTALLKELSNGEPVNCSWIRQFIGDNTIYISKHATRLLKDMEEDQSIIVEKEKVDGTPRRKGTFPDGTIIKINPGPRISRRTIG